MRGGDEPWKIIAGGIARSGEQACRGIIACRRERGPQLERKIVVAGAIELPTVRLGQAPCMGRRVNPARTGR